MGFARMLASVGVLFSVISFSGLLFVSCSITTDAISDYKEGYFCGLFIRTYEQRYEMNIALPEKILHPLNIKCRKSALSLFGTNSTNQRILFVVLRSLSLSPPNAHIHRIN